MDQGNLREYLDRFPQEPRLPLVSTLQQLFLWSPGLTLFLEISDIVDGLCYLHDRGIVHGDIKGVRNFSPDSESGISGMFFSSLTYEIGKYPYF